jgi:hypothetical protein
MPHNKDFIEHVRKYQKDHGCTYREAQQLSKHTYKKKELKPRTKNSTKVVHKKRGRPKKVVEQEGEGIKDIYNSAKNALLSRLTRRPLSINNLLKTYGAQTISNVEVCRQPIMSVIRTALNIATGGDISKVVQEKGYDNVFHLYCIVLLGNGTKIRLDKNQRVSIEVSPKPLNKEAVCKSVVLPSPTTLTQFIDKGEELGNRIGSFWRYSAHNDNCQKFVKALLNASGVQSLDSFIMQDAGQFVKPGLFRKFAQGVTDAAALGEYAIKGGKRRKRRVMQGGCNCDKKKK